MYVTYYVTNSAENRSANILIPFKAKIRNQHRAKQLPSRDYPKVSDFTPIYMNVPMLMIGT